MTWTEACEHFLGVHRGYRKGDAEIDLVVGCSRGGRPLLLTVRCVDDVLSVIARAGGVDPRVVRRTVALFGATPDVLDFLVVTAAEHAAALRRHSYCDSYAD